MDILSFYEKSDPTAEKAGSQLLSDVWKKCSDSVVSITVTGEDGSGSSNGVVINKDGLIATTASNVRQAENILVATNSGRRYQASLEQLDPQANVAILKAQLPGDTHLTPMDITQSPIAQGKTVFGLGRESWACRTAISKGTTEEYSSIYNLTRKHHGLEELNDRAITTLRTTGGSIGSLNQYLTEPRLVVQMETGLGQGGGPIVDLNGKLVGLIAEKQDCAALTLGITPDKVAAVMAATPKFVVHQEFENFLQSAPVGQPTLKYGLVAPVGALAVSSTLQTIAKGLNDVAPEAGGIYAACALSSALSLPADLLAIRHAGDYRSLTEAGLRLGADTSCIGSGLLALRAQAKGKGALVAGAAFAASWAMELAADLIPSRLMIKQIKPVAPIYDLPAFNSGFNKMESFTAAARN